MAPRKAVGKAAPATRKRKSPDAVPASPGEESTARVDFLQDVALAAGVDRVVTEKTIEALVLVVGRQVREKQYCRIPNMMQVRLKIKPAREACTRKAFGKEVQVSARAAVKKVFVSPLKPLKLAVE